MTREQREELRRVAAGATPGPWTTCGASEGQCKCGIVLHESGYMVASTGDDGMGGHNPLERSVADRHYLAAVSPDVVTGLLDEIEAAEGRIEALKRAIAVGITDATRLPAWFPDNRFVATCAEQMRTDLEEAYQADNALAADDELARKGEA